MMLSITAALAGDTSEGFTTAQLPFTKQVFHVFTEEKRESKARESKARESKARESKARENGQENGRENGRQLNEIRE